jgi:hypothetical protein
MRVTFTAREIGEARAAQPTDIGRSVPPSATRRLCVSALARLCSPAMPMQTRLPELTVPHRTMSSIAVAVTACRAIPRCRDPRATGSIAACRKAANID